MRDEAFVRRRSLTIAALGPSVFVLGLAWTILRLLLADPTLTLRAIAFAPAHQMMVVGALISAICLPVAAAVRRADPDELSLPGFEAKQPEPRTEPPGDGGRRRRRSYHGYN
jgi:hypothetical protein